MAKKSTSTSYKDKYYEERFSAIVTLLNGHMGLITEKLESIEIQTKKTNGRVNDLEAFSKEAQKVIDTREINCPVVKNLDQRIESRLTEKYADLHFFLRHPKLFIGAIVVLVLLSIATFIETNPLRVFNKTVKTESTK